MGVARGDGRVIAGPAVAVPEVAVLGGFAVAIGACIVWIAARGVHSFWNLTFGSLFLFLAGINLGRGHISLGHPFGFFETLNNKVVNKLFDIADGAEATMGYFFHQSARLQLWIGQEIVDSAQAAFHFGSWVVSTYVPTALHYAGTIAFPWPAIYKAIHSELAKAAPGVAHVAHGAVEGLDARIGRLLRPLTIKEAADAAKIAALGAALGALGGSIAWPHGGLSLPKGVGIPKSWTKWRTRVDRRLTKVEGIAAAAVFAGLLANTLGVTKTCVRSGNIGKAARRLCGLDTSLLNGLLAGLILYEGGFSVVKLAEEMLAVEQGLIAGMKHIVTEL